MCFADRIQYLLFGGPSQTAFDWLAGNGVSMYVRAAQASFFSLLL